MLSPSLSISISLSSLLSLLSSLPKFHHLHLLNPQQRAPRLRPQLHPPQPLLPETPHLAVPAEAKVRAPALDLDLADQHAPAVPDVDAIAAGGVDVAEDVRLDAVRGAGVGVGEDAPVGEEGGGVVVEDGVGVDGGGAAGVEGAVAVDEVRVGDVDGGFVRGEGDAVGAAEAVGDDADVAAGGVEAVHVLGELRFGAEALLVAVDGVGEPDGAVGVDDDVVGGVEGPGVVVVKQGGGFVGALGFHVDEAGGFAERALGAEDEAVAVVGAAVGHVVALGAADFVTGEVGGGEEFDLGDDDGFAAGGDGVGGGVFEFIRCDEEGVRGGVEDAGFVEIGGAWVVDEALQGWIGAEEGEEGFVVDEEGVGVGCLWRHDDGSGDGVS